MEMVQSNKRPRIVQDQQIIVHKATATIAPVVPTKAEIPLRYDSWSQTEEKYLAPLPPKDSQETDPRLIEVILKLQMQIALQTTLLQKIQAEQKQTNHQKSQQQESVVVPTSTAANYRILANGVLEPVEIDLCEAADIMHDEQDDSLAKDDDVKLEYLEEAAISSSSRCISPKDQKQKIWNFSKSSAAMMTPTTTTAELVYSTPTPDTSANTSTELEIELQNHPDMMNLQVSIGPNNTKVPAKVFDAIKWASPSIATRKLLTSVFERKVLATHTMTGKPSPAFKDTGKPQKKMLDQNKIADIIFAVTRKTAASEKEVRNVITTKCADENKMLKAKEKKSLLNESNKENVIY